MDAPGIIEPALIYATRTLEDGQQLRELVTLRRGEEIARAEEVELVWRDGWESREWMWVVCFFVALPADGVWIGWRWWKSRARRAVLLTSGAKDRKLCTFFFVR